MSYTKNRLLAVTAEVAAAGAVVLWRVLRLRVDSGVWSDWVFVCALLWAFLAVLPSSRRREWGAAATFAAALYLFGVYAWYQLGATTRFFQLLG